MTKKTEIWKTSTLLVISLTFLMMAAASVNAEETIPRSKDVPVDDSTTSNDDLTDNMLISPGPEEPLVIAPNPDTTNEEADNLVISSETADKQEISTMALPAIAIIVLISGMVVSLIILKIKK